MRQAGHGHGLVCQGLLDRRRNDDRFHHLAQIDYRGRSYGTAPTRLRIGEPLKLPKQAAGILLYRRSPGGLEVLLAHPGGPLWARKDLGAWTIPKGQFGQDESALDAAKREFEEEMGSPASGAFVELGSIRQPSGKIVHAFTAESDFDVTQVKSNLFSLEWPPRSGRTGQYPEVDRAEWFSIEDARRKILKGQEPFLDRLLAALNTTANGSS